MKKYMVTSNETMQYFKIVNARTPEQARRKAYKDSSGSWNENYDNCETMDVEVEEYHGE